MPLGLPWQPSLSSSWRSSRALSSAHSSTSSSEATALRCAKTLIGICAILVVALEVCSVYLLKNYSVTFARVSRQYAEAVKVRPAAKGEPTSVLIVGNSLLLHGVDVDRLQQLTSANMRIYPIFLEGTGYYDWLYGLRRLFREGARPQVVVVGLEVNSSLVNGVWEESPMMLFDAKDVLDVSSDLGLDRTATSNVLLSHVSAFWGMRTFFRRRVLRSMVPHYEDLFPFVRSDQSASQDPELEAILKSRLQSLRELCAEHGAELIVVIPPTPSSEIAVRRMALAAQKAGVEALVPIDPNVLSASFYQRDRVHLNPEGAARFTSALAVDLSRTIVALTNGEDRSGEKNVWNRRSCKCYS